MRSRTGLLSLVLLFGAVFVAVGAFSLYLTFPHGEQRLVSATRVLHSSGQEEICPGTNQRCLYIVELPGITPDPCSDSNNPIWRDGRCWQSGQADEFPPRRESITKTWGIAVGDTVQVVFDPNNPDNTRLSGSAARVIPFLFMAPGFAIIVAGAWRFRRSATVTDTVSEAADEHA